MIKHIRNYGLQVGTILIALITVLQDQLFPAHLTFFSNKNVMVTILLGLIAGDLLLERMNFLAPMEDNIDLIKRALSRGKGPISKRKELVDYEKRTESAKEVWLAGKSLFYFIHANRETFEKQIRSGVKFRFLISDSACKELMSVLSTGSKSSKTSDEVQKSIENAAAIIKELTALSKSASQVEIKQTKAHLPHGITLINPRSDAIQGHIELFSYNRTPNSRWCIEVNSSSDREFSLYIRQQFDALWN